MLKYPLANKDLKVADDIVLDIPLAGKVIVLPGSQVASDTLQQYQAYSHGATPSGSKSGSCNS